MRRLWRWVFCSRCPRWGSASTSAPQGTGREAGGTAERRRVAAEAAEEEVHDHGIGGGRRVGAASGVAVAVAVAVPAG